MSTDGGRYDVTLSQRVRRSVYWDEPQSSVRRCTWFYKGDNEHSFTPYQEELACKLEVRSNDTACSHRSNTIHLYFVLQMEYEAIVKKGLWHKGVDLGNREMVVVHNPQLIVHYQVVFVEFSVVITLHD